MARRVAMLSALAGPLAVLVPVAALPPAASSAATSTNFAGYQMAFEAPSGAVTQYGAAATGSDGTALSGTSPSITALAAGGYETVFENSAGVLQSVGTGAGGFDAVWPLGMLAGTSPSITALPTGGVEVAFQANTGRLWTVGTGPGSFDAEWPLGVLAGTSPSVTALPTGGVEAAFQAPTGALWTVGDGAGSSDTTWTLSLDAGSSPSITALSAGFETASEGSNDHLWTTGASGTPTDTGQPMMHSTSPAIASSATDYEAAVQSATGTLVEFGPTTTIDTGQALRGGTSPAIAPPLPPAQSSGSGADFAGYQMAYESPSGSVSQYGAASTGSTGTALAGTSPSIAALYTGGYETVFENSAGALQSVGNGPGAFDAVWNLGMLAGTSPSIAALPTGGVEVAFQANTGRLWTVGTGPGSFDAEWPLGMAPGTSPSIAALPTGGVEVAFEAPGATLWTVGNGGGSFDAQWNLGMEPGSSPSIAALRTGGVEVAFQASSGKLWTVGNGAGASDTTWTVGLDAGSSPAIAPLSGGGGFETASEGSNDHLWTTGSSGSPTDTGQAMLPATSPAIASSGSSYETAFQAPTGMLVEFGPATTVVTGQSVHTLTSPAIAPSPPPSPTSTTGPPYGSGASGYDISWPQCGGALPPQAPVAVVGVNDGSAFTTNPCFNAEASWGGSQLTVYLNLNSPQGSNSSQYLQGPAGSCTLGDLSCESYNYGYNTAIASIQTALSYGYQSYTWWLDVETGNYWTSDTAANAQVVAGALDAIRGAGYQVAVYSTNYQWTQIVGSYVPSAPAWYPTGTATSTPYNWCSSSSFAGGPIYLVQSAAGNYDGDYSC